MLAFFCVLTSTYRATTVLSKHLNYRTLLLLLNAKRGKTLNDAR